MNQNPSIIDHREAIIELREENRHLKDQLASLSSIKAKDMRRLSDMIDRRTEALEEIRKIMLPLAGNRRFMQIAGPARECLNIIRRIVPNNVE